jgi:hypothetical protein
VHDRELQPHVAHIRALGHLWLAFDARRDHSVEGSNIVAREAQTVLEILQQTRSTADPEIVVIKKSPARGKAGSKSRAIAHAIGSVEHTGVSTFVLS